MAFGHTTGFCHFRSEVSQVRREKVAARTENLVSLTHTHTHTHMTTTIHLLLIDGIKVKEELRQAYAGLQGKLVNCNYYQ